MPMPTTRRGRFLLYKRRQRDRLRRVRQKKDKWYMDNVPGWEPTTHRYRLWEGHTKQMPRVYPQHFPEKSMPAAVWLLFNWTPPERGKWGVVRRAGNNFEHPDWPFQENGAVLGYYDRRLLSIPRLKNLPWSGYMDGIDRNLQAAHYPFFYYPSGRPSYASTKGWVTL